MPLPHTPHAPDTGRPLAARCVRWLGALLTAAALAGCATPPPTAPAPAPAPASAPESASAPTATETAPAPTPDASACPPEPPLADAAFLQRGVREARDRGFLWRLERDGRTSWLYGTIHAAEPPWAFLGPTIVRALHDSDRLAVELVVDQAPTRRALRQGGGDAAAAVLTAGRRARRDALAASLCLPAAALDPLPPALQATRLLVQQWRRDGLFTEYAVDSALIGAARALGTPVEALETAQHQLRVLSGGSVAEQRRRFDQTMAQAEASAARQQVRRLARAWADSDWDTLRRYPEWCACMNSAAERAQMHELLDARNAPMAGRIEALHAGGARVFAAVGMLHMIGPRGLPELLRARGFRVSAVLPGG